MISSDEMQRRPLRAVGSMIALLAAVSAGCAKTPATGAKDSTSTSPTGAASAPSTASSAMAAMPGMNMKADSATSTSGDAKSIVFTADEVRHGGVRWQAVVQQSVSGSVELPGRLTANEDRARQLGAIAEGRVVSVHVSPGDRVARGARLVTMQSPAASMAFADKSKADAELRARTAAAAYARTARDRAERLLALKAIPRQEYERAIADDELARSALSQALAEVTRAASAMAQLGVEGASGELVLRAPIDGIVTARTVVPGAVVMVGMPIVTIADPAQLWLTLSVPELEASGVHVGTALRFVAGATSRDTFTAVVQSVSGAFDSNTRALPVRAIVRNSRGQLRPEMFAKVWLVQRGMRGVAVADSAVQRIGDSVSVFIARPDGNGGATFSPKTVLVGATSNGIAVITRGLNAGDIVVVAGAFTVKSKMLRAGMPKMEM